MAQCTWVRPTGERCPLPQDHAERCFPICQWFALCDRPATVTIPHPVLGLVPACDRCKERAQ